MTRFRPFRAVRFCQSKVGDMRAVVAPPYDVIDEESLSHFYEASPYNVVRLILNRRGHAEAGDLFRDWLGSGLCRRDEESAFYLYSQDFECEGKTLRRTGVIGALQLEPFSSGMVRPHERTFSKHKKDRLDLTLQVKANLSPIFGLYSNGSFSIQPEGGWQAEADIDVVQDAVRHRMWTLRRPETVAAVEAAVAGRTIFIADGHHRYETALNYYGLVRPDLALGSEDAGSDEDRPEAHVLAFLSTFEDPGMVILPTHRELLDSGGADHEEFAAELEKSFDLQRFERNADGRRRLLEGLAGLGRQRNSLAVAMRDLDCYLLASRPLSSAAASSPLAGLDVSVLHDEVIEGGLTRAGGGQASLAYGIDAADMLDRVERGEIEGAFLLNATRSDQMSDVCMAGELMPQKSTYFYPKLITGLVFHLLDASPLEGPG
ncbi:MAG: DUF1015 domain-containing protein [Deltaproteobacteria bacterium]